MISTSVYQTHCLIPQENLPQKPECNFRLREQECVSLIKKCNNLQEFKQAHAQILKLGMIWTTSFVASNLVATCALSDWGSMAYASLIFRQIEEPGSFAFNNMIRGYVKDMNLEEALQMYDEMLVCGVEPDNFTYPTLLKACANLPALEEGMQVHGHSFKLGFEDDVFVQNSLINMYGKCGERGLACAVFEKMEQKSVASWSALISAHASLGMWCECLEIFGNMSREGCCRAEESMLVNVLSSCTHLGALDLGRCTHGSLLRNMSGLNVIVETSLIDMYVKCGCLDKGLLLFQRMSKKNQMSYSVMISGLALHGCGLEALKVSEDMLEQGLEPDDVAYVGMLSACSHAGLVEEGLQCFERMKVEHGIVPTIQHYGCMVDLMGRAGKLNEAYAFIKSIPIEPNDVLWRTLLGACKVHQNVEMGEVAARSLFLLNSHNASDYVALSNTYAQAQRWSDVSKTWKEMACKGLVQTMGFSLVEVKRKVHKFVSQDKSSPQCDGIYEMLHQMEWQLKFEGYSPDTSQVLLDVGEEEKRQRLSSHSQKLAIAFALIHTSQGFPVRIIRNIRMCSDCHTYTKLISMIYEREITVRDRNRFHHFKDGSCSCRDYW
ncbi:Pentatricopeptide repeat-containing protein [Actinidia chinensis var. chinensis]|uniref:Pentatricopeptide repeat-containing protein n=1 Tax=Actinidia chinensis var. chinensis TaxID=1590841 RepID=A0A2R6Q3D1_ACTCC|nr:Pentatricopeptide repeat-containing protein [Actinidia chinensis var. chinensis]